jgi:hypothetical protein
MSSGGDLHVVVQLVQGCEEQLEEAPREVEEHDRATGFHQTQEQRGTRLFEERVNCASDRNYNALLQITKHGPDLDILEPVGENSTDEVSIAGLCFVVETSSLFVLAPVLWSLLVV